MTPKRVGPSPKRVDTLERGNVYFFFRPKAEKTTEKLQDVQRMFVVLSPEESQGYRLLVIASNGLEKNFGFVDAVSNDPKNIEDRLAPEASPTKTGTESHFSALRPIAQGVYRIVRHGEHTHFVYALELPRATGGAQAAFELENEASYIISIKNPENGSPLATDLEQPVDLSIKLREKFRGRRFLEADPPDLLNHAGIEFVLISAVESVLAENVIEELGFDFQPEDESLASANILNELKMQASVHSSKPFF
jgi:hypothetical protein